MQKPLRKNVISKQFVGFTQMAGIEANDGISTLTLHFALRAMRHFLHLAPKNEGKEREAYIQRRERMMTAYVVSRLLSAM